MGDNRLSITLGELLLKEFPPGTHIIKPGILKKGAMLVIGGLPKSYKSFLLMDVIVSLATGAPLWNATRAPRGGERVPAFPVFEPQRVLYLEQEIGDEDLKERFAAMLTKLNPAERDLCRKNILVRTCDHSMRIDSLGGCTRTSEIIDHAKPDIVAFDPLIEFHGIDEKDAQGMATAMAGFTLIRERHGVSLLLTHHTGKPVDKSTRSGTTLLRGSSVLEGKGDSFLMIHQPDRENHPAILNIKFTIRRGKPIESVRLELNNDDLRFRFLGWGRGKAKSDKVSSSVLVIGGQTLETDNTAEEEGL